MICVFFVWLLGMFYLHFPGDATRDTYAQLAQGVSGEYTNWKPALYSWFLGRAEALVEGKGIAVAFVCQIVGFGIGCLGIAWYYAHKNKIFASLILCLPLFFTAKCMGIATVGNDAAAAACYVLFFAGVLTSKLYVKNRLFFIVFSILILMVGLHLRHNSIFAVFVILLWFTGKVGVNSWGKRCLVSFLMIVLMFFSNKAIIDYGLKSQKTYPLKFGFAADLINLSILDGKWNDTCASFAKKEYPLPHHLSPLRPCVPNVDAPINPYIIYKDEEKDFLEYEKLKQGWIKEVANNPMRYLVMKCVFFEQYLFAGMHIPGLGDIVRCYYPHVSLQSEGDSKRWSTWVNRRQMGYVYIPLIVYSSLFVVGGLSCINPRFRRKVAQSSEMIKDAFSMGAVAMVYTFTMFPVVFSASESRFYIVRASLCSLSFSLLLIALLSVYLEKRRMQKLRLAPRREVEYNATHEQT